VVAHENAHKAVAGGLANGAIHYDTRKGPDGKDYRVGGHVNINTSKGKTPEETMQRAQKIRSAALAPASPSGADRSVANKASRMMTEARQEMSEESAEEVKEAARKVEEENKKTEKGIDEASGEEENENEITIKTTKISVEFVPEGEEGEDENGLVGEQGSLKPQTEESREGKETEPGHNHEDHGIQPEIGSVIPGSQNEDDQENDLIANLGQAINSIQGQNQGAEKAGNQSKAFKGNFKVPQFEVSKALTGYNAAMMASIQTPPPGSTLRVRA